jgi:methionine-rich copper-binding protein CopC
MRIRPVLASVSIAALLAALPAIAAAHAELESSTPEAGENLHTAPTEVTLTFSEELDPDGSSFTVVDADGHEVGTGEVDLTVADRNVMTGDVRITDAGVYAVKYTVVAADGHESRGSISFGYNAAEAIPGSTTDDQPDTAIPGPSLSLASVVGWLLLALAGVLGVRRVALR